jgi:hypothetical protein
VKSRDRRGDDRGRKPQPGIGIDLEEKATASFPTKGKQARMGTAAAWRDSRGPPIRGSVFSAKQKVTLFVKRSKLSSEGVKGE